MRTVIQGFMWRPREDVDAWNSRSLRKIPDSASADRRETPHILLGLSVQVPGITFVLYEGMNHTIVAASPFACCWIYREPEGRSDPNYAICMRVPLRPRVVCERECECCHAWEPPDSDAPAGRRHNDD